MVVQEIAKVRKTQKEQDAAVAKLFRNTLPARPSGDTEPTEPTATASNHDGATGDTAASSFGVSELITWLLSLFQSLLSSIGIRVPGAGNQQQAST